jgi:hypothetical protein
MSLRKIEVACDWPSCGETCSLSYSLAGLRDRKWAAMDEVFGPHLCPAHRFRTWVELEEARQAAEG